MNDIERAIQQALNNNHDQLVNKAYLEFIKANFIIPIENKSDDHEPKVLFLQEHDKIFLPVFTNMKYFNDWAEPIKNEIKILRLSGVNLLKGIGEHVFVSLNIGSDIYKEFNDAEIARMRSMVLKLFN
ncbi:MAG: SseB family protein [Legionella sp.]